MKFGINIRGTPKSKIKTDAEIRARLANLTYHEDFPEAGYAGKESPKRSRTVSSRHSTPLHFDHDETENLKPTQPIGLESAPEATPKDRKDQFSRRNTVHYNSPKQRNDDCPQDPGHSKTPKKPSPAFSLNRKSIREPLAYFKQQSRELFRRGTIKDLFPTTPEKNTCEIVQKDHDTQQDYLDDLLANSIPYDHTKETELDHSQSRYHTARVSQTLDSHENQVNETPDGVEKSDNLNPDASQNVQGASPCPVRSPSLHKDSDDLRNISNEPESNENPSMKAIIANRLSVVTTKSSKEGQTKTASAEQRFDKEDTARAVGDSAEKKIFKSNSKNFFPLWASEPKEDGRMYTQKEIIKIISPEEL